MNRLDTAASTPTRAGGTAGEQSVTSLREESASEVVAPETVEIWRTISTGRAPHTLEPTLQVTAAGILSLLAIVFALSWARAVLIPIVSAVLLWIILRPVVRRGERWHLPAYFTALVCMSGLVAAGVGGTSTVLQPATEWLATAPEQLDEAMLKLRSLRENVNLALRAQKKVEDLTAGEVESQPVPVTIQPSQLATSVSLASSTGSLVGSAVIVLVLAYYLLVSGDHMLNQLLGLMPTWTEKRRTVELVNDVQGGVTTYLLTITGINVALGGVVAVAMAILGMPHPVMWGVMAGTFNFIPVIGAIAGAVLLGISSIIAFPTLSAALVPPVLFLVLTGIEGNVITPAILGRSNSLNPIAVFLALVFWGWLWGIAGAILAVPLLNIFKLTCEAFVTTRPVARLLAG